MLQETCMPYYNSAKVGMLLWFEECFHDDLELTMIMIIIYQIMIIIYQTLNHAI